MIINGKADEVTEELSKSLFSIYQIGLETVMKGSSFMFNPVDLLNWKCLNVKLNCRFS